MTEDSINPNETSDIATDADILRSARDRIVASGCLGRSVVYQRLLDYLIDCAIAGRQPKEIDIAIDVLGRDGDFDIGKDSIVRVTVFQLRNRLEKYYRVHANPQEAQLTIPKGQYALTLLPVAAIDSTRRNEAGQHSYLSRRTIVSGFIIMLLLVANVWQWAQSRSTPSDVLAQTLALHPWQALVDDDLPVMIVMGDYYIFGELDEQGRISRMVRDFFINSRDDLMQLFLSNSELQSYFRDLDMSYMPEGSASALLDIAPIVKATGKRSQVKMMSRLSTADLRNNHIIYIGYVSAMDKLNNLYFTQSGLLPGITFDQLVEKRSGRTHVSTAGLPEQGEPFRDLALFASWKAATGNQFIIISGTRDAGLMHSATLASSPALLQQVMRDSTLDSLQNGFETLIEVFGIDRTNFDSAPLYTQPLLLPHMQTLAD